MTSGRTQRRRTKALRPIVLIVLSAGCVYVPLRGRAIVREREYFETHREVPPAIARAIEQGHVILGMDREQVVVVLGEPLRRTDHGGAPSIEVWLYQGFRFHQDLSHGASLYRLVFRAGLLALIEPL